MRAGSARVNRSRDAAMLHYVERRVPKVASSKAELALPVYQKAMLSRGQSTCKRNLTVTHLLAGRKPAPIV